jgi:hypothetical protein
VGVDGANPYLPPQAPIADGGSQAAVDGRNEAEPALPPWRLEGRTLFARHGTTLPDICLFTGEPTKPAHRVRYPLSWTPLWFRLIAVPWPIVAATTYSALRRSSNVELALGPAGQRRHRLGLLLCLAAMCNGIALFLRLTSPGSPVNGLLLVTLVALIVAVMFLRVFRVAKIDRRYAHLRLRPRVAAAFARLPPPPPVSF